MRLEGMMEWVLDAYPERVNALFDALDLDHAGLREVKAAVECGDMPGACQALLDYYRTGDSGEWLRGPAVLLWNASAERFAGTCDLAETRHWSVRNRADGTLEPRGATRRLELNLRAHSLTVALGE